jgi:hypothetical protein
MVAKLSLDQGFDSTHITSSLMSHSRVYGTLERLSNDPTIEETQFSCLSKRPKAPRQVFQNEKHQGEAESHQSIMDEVDRARNRPQTHSSVLDMAPGSFQVEEAPVQRPSSIPSRKGKTPLKDRMMLAAAPCHETSSRGEEYKRSVSLGEILEDFPQQERRRLSENSTKCSPDNESKTMLTEESTAILSSLASEILIKPPIAMLQARRVIARRTEENFEVNVRRLRQSCWQL